MGVQLFPGEGATSEGKGNSAFHHLYLQEHNLYYKYKRAASFCISNDLQDQLTGGRVTQGSLASVF